MASSYTGLGTELMTTGENAGDWGSKTNTNLQIIEQIAGGYTAQSIAGGVQTTTLSVSDGSTGAVLAHRVIEFTGTITGNQTITIPLDVQTFYVMKIIHLGLILLILNMLLDPGPVLLGQLRTKELNLFMQLLMMALIQILLIQILVELEHMI